MLLTDADVERIAARVVSSPDLLALQREIGPWHFEAEDGYLQLHVRPGGPAKGSPGGAPCWFLGDDGLCRIWSDRPEGCRMYPAVWDDSVREAVLDEDYCPHTDGFALSPEMDAATESLAERLHAEQAAREHG